MMKKYFHIIFCFLLLTFYTKASDSDVTFPSVEIKSLDGTTINTSSFVTGQIPFMIVFWATWCGSCVSELTEMMKYREKWEKERGIRIIAVAIQEEKEVKKIKSKVAKKGWSYEFYLDKNMNFLSHFVKYKGAYAVPHTMLFDKDGKIIWSNISKMKSQNKKRGISKLDEEYYWSEVDMQELDNYITKL